MWQFRIPSWIILYLLALLAQTALLPQIFPAGYVPDLVLSVTIIIALYETPRRGLAAGLIGGLMQDVWAGRLWGLNALTFALVGFVVASLESRIVRDNIFVPGLLAGLAQLLVVPFQWVILRMFGFAFSWHSFTHPLPVWLLFSMLITPAIGGLLGFRPRHEVDRRYSRGRHRSLPYHR
ncbi:rod shape-determining protein MreD [Sulfobacillus harzensis]|uniref:Rod shape-determining protein MreD n=1 Tax=Sulfobacillus harzensis TaxID=2729629 RepID=A0A7Y0Q0N9_9FIRM|nr:rod shape-determining protein MreD [Sulfobacillus harzensis]NMP21243.1 rod shape-determining protein MreD [Sulfobacillus harzensis]